MANVSRRTFFKTSAAALGLAALGRASTSFLRAPYLQRLVSNQASVLWTASDQTSANVTVIAPDGTSSSFAAQSTYFDPSVTGSSYSYYQYRADITGLQPGASYQYQITANGNTIAADPLQNSFTTPTTGNFSFLVMGDTGNDSPEQFAVLQQMMLETNISKIVHVGDIAYNLGTFPQFEQNYFALYAPLMGRVPFFTTPGNHEYLTNSAAPYLAVHAAPDSALPVPAQDHGRYYSYDWGDVHFTTVDTNLLSDTAASARMLAWLDADLGASTKYWKLVFLHHPSYPTGAHLGDPLCVLAEQKVNPIVEKHGVPLVLSGHEHGYERTFPLLGGVKAAPGGPSTTYVISGGGGAELVNVGSLPQVALSQSVNNYLRVDVSGWSLKYTAKGITGGAIDIVTVAPPPVVTGVTNAGDYSKNIAPGSLVSIFGQNLSVRQSIPKQFPLPVQIDGLSITVNGTAAPILFASPGQVNVQIPYGISGSVTLQVTTPNGSTATTVTIAPTAPSILAVVSGNALVSASNPAVSGGYVTVYAIGLGAPQTSCPAGQAPASANAVKAPVQVMLGTAALQPAYAGLAPGFAGLNQVNVQIPAATLSNLYTLKLMASGVSSIPVSINVVSASQAPA